MAKILSYGKGSGSEKNSSKGNPLKSVWGSFQSLDKFGKFFILTALLVIIATPFIASNLLEVRQRAEAPAELPPQAKPEPPSIPDEILLKFKPGVAQKTKDKFLSENQLSVKSEIKQIGVKILQVNPSARDSVIAALSHRKEVDYAEKNIIVSTTVSPNDPVYVQTFQWNLKKIQAPLTWDITKGSPNTPVAILDTGVDYTHPDLQGKVIANANFSDSDSTIDRNGHGTHVAGIAGAATNNGLFVAGLGWDTPIMNGKVLGDNGTGGSSWIAQGVIWAADNGTKAINISAGAPFTMPVLQDAINYAWGKGIVVVAAAGNFATSSAFYPAAYPNVIAVASTDIVDHLASSSDYGDWVDVAAPGANIYSTLPVNDFFQPGGYGVKGGTSMASPHVAGLAALIYGQATDKNGNGFLNDEVVDCIVKNADNIGISGIGGGRINALKAVQCGSTSPTDTTPPVTSITSPSSGQTVSGGINIDVTASDNVGVTRVDLYLDGTLSPYASDTTSPYSFFWDTTTATNGNHTLFARAHDNTGNIGNSSIVTTTVNNTAATPTPTRAPTSAPTPTPISGDTTPPSVSVTNPLNGAILKRNLAITITASATDNTGISKVEFYVNGALTCTDTSSPYTCSWKAPGKPNANYTISAKAYDLSTNSAINAVNVKTAR